MALSLTDKCTYANDIGILFNRVKAAVAETAITILSEDVLTQDHNLRLGWAQKTLEDLDTMAKKMLWAVLGNKNVTDTLPDAQSAKASIALAALGDDIIRTTVNDAVIGFVNA